METIIFKKQIECIFGEIVSFMHKVFVNFSLLIEMSKTYETENVSRSVMSNSSMEFSREEYCSR